MSNLNVNFFLNINVFYKKIMVFKIYILINTVPNYKFFKKYKMG